MLHARSGDPSEGFASLDRVVGRYRRDVHQLAGPAAPEAITALEAHLGQRRLPSDLRRFLAQHNGVALFRGALRVRSTSDIAAASAEAPQVVLFADGPPAGLGGGDDRPWAF